MSGLLPPPSSRLQFHRMVSMLVLRHTSKMSIVSCKHSNLEICRYFWNLLEGGRIKMMVHGIRESMMDEEALTEQV